jgi:hypothetical protein
MTFDDGLREHYADVTPILAEQDIQGFFFLISSCIEDGIVAPVHMNHFLTAHLGFKAYQAEFMDMLREMGFADAINADPAVFRKTYPLDTAEVAQFKYLFNFLLPAQTRDQAVKKLFLKHLGNEREFSCELYLNWSEAREMQKAGMIIGGHTHQHRSLATLRYPEMYADLSRNWDLIQKHLLPQEIWPFSYPYGKADSYNRHTVEILRQLGYRFALCTEPGNNLPGIDLFSIRRVDCKDIIAAAHRREVPYFVSNASDPAATQSAVREPASTTPVV